MVLSVSAAENASAQGGAAPSEVAEQVRRFRANRKAEGASRIEAWLSGEDRERFDRIAGQYGLGSNSETTNVLFQIAFFIIEAFDTVDPDKVARNLEVSPELVAFAKKIRREADNVLAEQGGE